mgnify:CR=1 FL=1
MSETFLFENLKGKSVWAYCRNCHTMNKNPPMWNRPYSRGELAVFDRYECLFCCSWCAESIIVSEGEDPPKWWVDKVMKKRG